MNNTAANAFGRMRTSATTVRDTSTACDTGFTATTSRPDSLAELSRFWIFEESFFRRPNAQFEVFVPTDLEGR